MEGFASLDHQDDNQLPFSLMDIGLFMDELDEDLVEEQIPVRGKRSNQQSTKPNSNQKRVDATPKAKGRWSVTEHASFLDGLARFGREWKKYVPLIRSRTVVQIRTHAQKYFQKLQKQKAKGDPAAPAPTAMTPKESRSRKRSTTSKNDMPAKGRLTDKAKRLRLDPVSTVRQPTAPKKESSWSSPTSVANTLTFHFHGESPVLRSSMKLFPMSELDFSLDDEIPMSPMLAPALNSPLLRSMVGADTGLNSVDKEWDLFTL